ncbi:MAG: hypothetical protein GX638_13125 [Crenarchaeota archaeon]|nr:hypothetical protein [Thermoproteota archaeon]
MREKKILISIKPQWVEKILNGEKTVEIRKTMPKCELPVKVYIYCTKAIKFKDVYLHELKKVNGKYELGLHGNNIINGKVVGEFTLNKVEMLYGADAEIEKQTCLTMGELYKYAKGKNLYSWHIEDLIIYDTPKELSEFGLTKAPQSYQYIKE